jgi:hypothetical protein
MKTSIDSGIRQTLLDASVARGREKERDAPDELWTLAVTSSVIRQLPRLSLDGALGYPDQAGLPPDGPAPGDGDADRGGSGELAAPRDAGCRGLGHAGGRGDGGAAEANGVPAELCAEVSDERLGKLQLHVARAEGGLDIVISVADSHVKALIEAEQASLMKTLKDAGLRVASVKIGSPSGSGTGLAGGRGGAERPRAGASLLQPGARWRTYQGSVDEDDTDSEGVDLTA